MFSATFVFSLLSFVFIPVSSSGQTDGRIDLLVKKDASGNMTMITKPVEWKARRLQILDGMQEVMGTLPDKSVKIPLDIKVENETVRDGIKQITITFASERNDRIPAILFIPVKLRKPVPGILCLHQTTECGKKEPAGLCGNPDLSYAFELAKRGYVTIAPDYPNFGDYRFDPYSNGYASATMKGIWNHMAAVDLLQSLPEVDAERIGCIGHSLGGHNTLFLAAFDKRIKVAVTSCGFTSFRKYYKGDLTGWSHKGYMPRIADVFGKDPAKMPFDFPGALAAIAPRSLFINAPLMDNNFDIEGVRDCFNAALPVYQLLKASKNLVMINPDAPHAFPPEVRKAAYDFIDKKLKFRRKQTSE